MCVCIYIYIYIYIYIIYTSRGGSLYQIYKPEAKPSVHTSDINRTPRFVYCFYTESFPTLTIIEILNIGVV